jgi:A1 cistron-splicing factor AAR2
VTAHNVHPDARLARLLAADFSGRADEFVAEFELSFVLFLLLPSLPALEHWKAALHLVSSSGLCAAAVARSHAPHRASQVAACTERTLAWTEVAQGTLRVLMQQLALTPEDLFEDALTSDNFLRKTLALLARSAASTAASAELRDAGVELQNLVSSRFSLHISPTASAGSLDDDDEQPVIVDETDAAHADSEEAAAEACTEEHAGRVSGERMTWMLPSS